MIGYVPAPTRVEPLVNIAHRLGRGLHVQPPIPFSEVGNYFTGRKRTKYHEAAMTLYTRPCVRKDAFINAFVKAEKITDPSKDPRMIQFRTARYCAEISTYLKRLEHSLYQLRGEQVGFGHGRLIAKGLNQIERAALLRRKLDAFQSPIVRSLDCSRWDQHCSAELLGVEHVAYLAAIPDERFAELLSWQIRNIGRTSGGIVYKCLGGRMSGDMNTALGNCLLMIILLADISERTGWSFDILDDGDDCLFICEKDLNVERLPALFLDYGHELKLENETADFSKILFCQSKPVFDGIGYKFVRRPDRVLGYGITSIRNVQHAKAQAKLVYTMGLAELALDVGVPVLQEYAVMLMRCAGTTQTLNLDDDGLLARMRREVRTIGPLRKLKPRQITLEARLSFAEAFGISPWEQVLLETAMRDEKQFQYVERWQKSLRSRLLSSLKGTLKCWARV